MFLAALLSGGAAATLAVRYLREQATPLLAAEPPEAQVVVAIRPLGAGTMIQAKDLKSIPWPASAVPPGYVRTPAEAVGRGLLVAVAENEPLLNTKLADSAAGGGLPVMIEAGMRAISVKVDEVIGVAGFVLPGTRVDVLVTLAENTRRDESSTRVILQNVRTLAAGQSSQRDVEGKPKEVTVITLLVSPEEAEMLALAANQGRIQLALRNQLDTAAVATRGVRVAALKGRSDAPPAPRSAAAAAVSAPPPRAPETVVEGFRGGEKILTTFNANP
jgi:pilus assembly protein CpaB